MINTTGRINPNTERNNKEIQLKKDDCNIEEFFRNKNVFITGATGFLGAVLLEALLSVSSKIGKIYVLVREKDGNDPKARLNRLLSKAIFAHHTKEILAKVVPVVGELSEPNFGLSDEQISELRRNVHIIYHSAASINLNAQIRLAVKSNVIGTLRTLELAKSLDNLVSYIYLSTAFCNCDNQGIIKEHIYPSHYDPRQIIEMVEDDSTDIPDKEDPKFLSFLKNQPNSYTMSKQLAENLIAKEMVGYPVGIVRPSVIYPTYRDPIEGWCGNARSGHLAMLAGFMKGIIRTVIGQPKLRFDVIPCDYVVSSSIAMGWYVGTHELNKPEVIHCTSGEQNPLTFEDLCEYMNQNVSKHPCLKFVWKPFAKVRSSWRNTISIYLFHLLPALLFWLPEKIFKLGKPNHSLFGLMLIFHNSTRLCTFFLLQEFRYDLKNSLRLQSKMHANDRLRYNFDVKTVDWSTMLERCFKGMRHYHFRESKETTLKHDIVRFIYEVLYYGSFGLYFVVVTMIVAQFLPLKIAATIAFTTLSLLIWV